MRSLGITFFRLVLRPILGKTVHDPTSGFVGVNRRALDVFSRSFPLEYPEIEALVVLQRRRFRFEEVPCKMRPRTTGRSSITAVKSLYYIVHVLLGVFVNVPEVRWPPAAGRGAAPHRQGRIDGSSVKCHYRPERRAAADCPDFGAPRAHSRRVFGKLAAGDRGYAAFVARTAGARFLPPRDRSSGHALTLFLLLPVCF